MKIGQDHGIPGKPEKAEDELKNSALVFRQYLIAYNDSTTQEEKDRILNRMEEVLSSMNAVVGNAVKKEVRIQESKVAKDFYALQESENSDTADILAQDLNTFLESLEH